MPRTPQDLETRAFAVGQSLRDEMASLLESLPTPCDGPVRLGKAVGVDKVLASRLLRAVANRDPLAALQGMPGPEPLRKAVVGAARGGAPASRVEAASNAIDGYDRLIRDEAGDRGALDAILASWLPDSREKFEFSRKQSIFKAMSQLKGQAAATSLACAMMLPNEDGQTIDVVWLMGLFGLHRLRPDGVVKFATRRMSGPGAERRPRTLDGQEVAGLDGLRLDRFCSDPPPRLAVREAGDVVHYLLDEEGVGPRSAIDLVFAEVNRGEIPRSIAIEEKRKRHLFAEVSVPSRLLVFDVFIHRDLIGGAMPELFVYDTSFEGVANVNDRSRDMDRLDVAESLQPLRTSPSLIRLAEIANYDELISTTFRSLGIDAQALRGFRTRIDYPLYGSQITVAFDAA